MNEEKNKQQPKKKTSLGLIVIIAALVLIVVGFGLLTLKPSESNKDNKESNNNQQNNTEKTNNENIENNNTENDNTEIDVPTETPMEDYFSDIDKNDSKVQELYKKYHSSINPVQLSDNAPEKIFYSNEITKVTAFNNSIPNNYTNKIVDVVINDMNNNNLVNDNYESVIYEKIEKEFKSFFGNKITYNKDIFKYYEFINDGNTIKYVNNSGDISSSTATYTITKAEKDDDNIYIYEKVVVKDDNAGKNEEYTYRWKYEKQDDGNYYLHYVERA